MGLVLLLLLSQLTVQKDGALKGSATGVNCQGPNVSCSVVNGKWMLTVADGGTPGSVTSVSVTSANGVSGVVTTPTTTPAITLTLGNITPGSVAATGTVTGSNLSGTNTGDVTLGPVGAVPNANGVSLVGQLLNLQAANGTLPGSMTALTQSLGGNKIFDNRIKVSALGDGGTSPVEGIDDYGSLIVSGDLTQGAGTYREGAYVWYSPTYTGPSGTDSAGFLFTAGLSGANFKSYEIRGKEIVIGISNITYPRERARFTETGIFKLNAQSGTHAMDLLDGAQLNFSTADSNTYLYRSAVDTISTPGTLLALNLTGTNTGDQTKTCSAKQWVSTLAATTTSTCTQPNYTDIAGSVPAPTEANLDQSKFLRGDGTWANVPEEMTEPRVNGSVFKPVIVTIQSLQPKCSPVRMFNCNR